MRQYDKARRRYEKVRDLSSDRIPRRQAATYSLALVECKEHPEDRERGIAALEQFVDSSPDSEHVEDALLQIGCRTAFTLDL